MKKPLRPTIYRSSSLKKLVGGNIKAEDIGMTKQQLVDMIFNKREIIDLATLKEVYDVVLPLDEIIKLMLDASVMYEGKDEVKHKKYYEHARQVMKAKELIKVQDDRLRQRDRECELLYVNYLSKGLDR